MTTVRYGRASNQTVFRSGVPLSDDVIAKYAPSVLAEQAHDSRGERYAFISTKEVINGLRREGFQPFEVRQTRVRQEERRDYTKHLVRLRHPDAGVNANGDYPEIVLVNSHDGTSAYRLLDGYFRYICSNGLICGDVRHDIKVRHSGKVVDNVIEGAFRVVEDLKQVANVIDEFQSIQLEQPERLLLANAAADVRWGVGEPRPVQSESLVVPRRYQDNKPDLWTAFNVVQENVLKGGVAGKSATGRNVSTRAVQGVTENVRLNRALWTLADTFAGLKTGRIDPRELQAQIAAADKELSVV